MDKQAIISKYAYAPAICWGILIVYFSLMPSNEVPGLLKNMQDAGLHFAIYGMLGLLLFLAQTSFQLQMISGYHATLIFVLGSSLGFIIELAQENLIAGRTFEWGDVMANMAGSSLFFIVNFLAKKKSANTSKL